MKNETFVQGLRSLAFTIESSRKELELSPVRLNVWCSSPEEMIETARAIGGRFDKIVNENYYILRRSFGEHEIDVFMSRATICKKVVTGTVEVEVPDPDAPKITVTQEVTEWDCSPSLLAIASRIPEVVE
jgi:hypothetical protein